MPCAFTKLYIFLKWLGIFCIAATESINIAVLLPTLW